MKIAIHPDKLRLASGEIQSFSQRWIELAGETGIDTEVVDAFGPEALERIRECDGFMWRFDYLPPALTLAKCLVPAIEQGLRIPVFPSWKTSWHFEDKIAQFYLLRAAGVPIPRTDVFWNLSDALRFCAQTSYPFVLKLAYGFQSSNVRLLRNRREATKWMRKIFLQGVHSIRPSTSSWPRRVARRMRHRFVRRSANQPGQLQMGSILVQEFLEGNGFDTRVTVIGSRAFAFRRFNRPEDFRASGSGRIDWCPEEISEGAIRLSFRVAMALETQSVAVDVLKRGEEEVVVEISYTYASWAVRKCPGHWELHGTPSEGELQWCTGEMSPEDAIFADFVSLLKS